MAFVLTLVKKDDFSGDVSTLSLAGYTAGFDLAEKGWAPTVPQQGDERLLETIRLRAAGASIDGLAAYEQALRDYLREMHHESLEDTHKYEVWVRVQAEGETLARQAMITGWRLQSSSEFAFPARFKFTLPQYQMALERTAWWEDTAATTYTCNNMNLVGGMASYGAVYGDTWARLAQIKVGSDVGAPEKIWMGFRSERFGTAANFQPVWNLRLGHTFGTDTTGGITNADVTAQDGFKVITTFATDATLVSRVKIVVDNVTANEADQRGRFLVLLRCKVGAATVCRVRMKDGFRYASNFRTQSRVVVSDTDWNVYELGTVQIPSPGHLQASGTFVNYQIDIEAERVSGANALDLDCLIMIPIAEGWAYGEEAAINPASSNDYYILSRAGGQKVSMTVNAGSGTVYYPGVPRVEGGLPVGSTGYVVMAGGRVTAGGVATSAQVDVVMTAYHRWAHLRGAET